MHPAIRTQTDGLNEEYSEATSLDCSNMPDLTRQEFKDETDVNKVLARYGVDGLPRKPEYSEVDYNLDLQQAFEAVREAERSIARLPESIRAKFPTWDALFHGAVSGDLPRDLQIYIQEKEAAEKAALEAERAAKVPLTTPTREV